MLFLRGGFFARSIVYIVMFSLYYTLFVSKSFLSSIKMENETNDPQCLVIKKMMWIKAQIIV